MSQQTFRTIFMCMMAWLAVLLFFAPKTACAGEPWSTSDKVLGGLTTAAILSDWRQTQKIGFSCRHGGNLHELNPIIGTCPSNARVNAYFAASLGLTYVIADYLDGPWRKGYLVGIGAMETAVVHHNDKVGLFVFTVILF